MFAFNSGIGKQLAVKFETNQLLSKEYNFLVLVRFFLSPSQTEFLILFFLYEDRSKTIVLNS